MNRISRQEIAVKLNNLAKSKIVVAPIEVNGVLLYRPIARAYEILWDYSRPILSIKEYFFPPTEQLMEIERLGTEIHLTETLPDEKLVIFGVRACDARGMLALDALFLGKEPQDPYYAQRREQATLIGIACEVPGPACFCTRTGGGLDDPEGMDVMLYPHGDEFTIQVITPKGQALMSAFGIESDRVPAFPSETERSIPEMDAWPPHFAEPYWQQFSERCLSCRICAYVCPTCRCFDVRDEAVFTNDGSEKYERLRCWDACAGEPYRRVAGGHNPRAEKGTRLRNRFFCKFFYYPHQYGPTACTGCGRCIEACPVNVDITEVLDTIAGRA
jgi:sulfhydrogenase subunit beta (sulfur reductase)